MLVSGASRGIGRAIADGFAKRGARVAITGRDSRTLAAAARELSPPGATVLPVPCDVAEVDQIQACVERVVAELGRVDTLVNAAGVNRRQPAETYTPEQYDFILDVNLRGAFLLSQEAGRHMIERGAGCQVNVLSLNTHAPLKHVLPYAISKAGLGTMTRGLASEWGRHGVRVNGIAPGFILTDLTRKLWSQPRMQAWSRVNTPLGRLGGVDDLVGAAIFLASPAAAFVTGQVLYIDGGVSAGISWPIEEG